MRQLLRLSALMLMSTALLTACLRGQSSPSSGLRAPLSAFRARTEPVFGNTATNLQRIKQKPYTGSIRFVLMGDNRNSSPFTSGGNKVYAKVIDQINQLQPDFAINLGDFTFDNLEKHWRTFEQITAKIKSPYLTVIGNHDALFGRSYYEAGYTPPNPETGLDDYSFDYGNSRFIILDTANYNYTERQFKWLETQLSTPLKKIVFTHTPPRYGVWNHKLSPSPELSKRFMGMMEKFHADQVFLGHIHLYDQRQINGVNYLVSGGAGAPLDKHPSYGQSLHHVVLVEINGDQI
ncbi:MAG TPA: metallophosphoesterase, partial [Candidatus Obscuribacterales bacterium]